MCDSVAAVKRDAFECHRPCERNSRSVFRRGYNRPHVHALDGHAARRRRARLDAAAGRVGNAVSLGHPEALEGVVEHHDFRKVLDPIRRVPARDDESRRKAVEHRQLRAVHLVGHQHIRIFHEVLDRQALHEIRNRRRGGLVEAVERSFGSAGLDAGGAQDVLQARAHPFSVAHRAVAPLAPEHVRLKISAAVARALIHRYQARWRKLGFQVVQRKLERPLDEPADAQAPRGEVDARGNREDMVAHVERLVRRDGAVKIMERRF